MKRLLTAAFALSLLGSGAAFAQQGSAGGAGATTSQPAPADVSAQPAAPASGADASASAAPSGDYPACTSRMQDRCRQTGHMARDGGMKSGGHKRMKHAAKHHSRKSNAPADAPAPATSAPAPASAPTGL